MGHYDENSMEALRGNNINNINMEIVSEHSDFVSGGMLEMLLPNHKMKRLRKEDEEQKDAEDEDDNDDAEEVEDNALNGVGADDSSSEQHNNTTSISPQPTINMNKQIVSLTITSKIDEVQNEENERDDEEEEDEDEDEEEENVENESREQSKEHSAINNYIFDPKTPNSDK